MIEIDLQPELSLRWQKIKDAMKKTGVEACIFSSPTNLYYTAGRVFNGYAYFTADNDPVFFVRRPLGLKNGNICYIRKP